jgi:hypothetical protein
LVCCRILRHTQRWTKMTILCSQLKEENSWTQRFLL